MTRAKLFGWLLLPAMGAALLLPSTAPAAVDMFLKLDGVKGESRDAGHVGEIDVLAFSWGVSNAGAKGSKAGQPDFKDLSLTKYTDSASPLLFHRAATGEASPGARLTVRRAGGDRAADYLTYCLTDVRVTSMSGGGSGGEDRLTENISLSYGSFTMVVRPLRPDGSLGEPVVGGWDLIRALQTGDATC